jgi:hypothetical protein
MTKSKKIERMARDRIGPPVEVIDALIITQPGDKPYLPTVLGWGMIGPLFRRSIA